MPDPIDAPIDPPIETEPAADEACAFYAAILEVLNNAGAPYLVGGSHAASIYTGVPPMTKDIDVFCLAGDYPRLLKAGIDAGYEAEVEDERWIAKLKRGPWFCDVIFGSANMVQPVTESWFTEQRTATFCGVRAPVVAATELIWSKTFIMDRQRFDGNAVAQLILRTHEQIDWPRLLAYMEQHWEVLLTHVLRFRYIYPSERARIPDWVLDELLTRLADQREMPRPGRRACRGRLFSRDDFQIDITEWGFADAVGDHKQP